MQTSAPKIDATDIPQANNIFSLKKILGLFKTESSTILSSALETLFADVRAQQYYLTAASRSLGWVEPKVDSKEWALTAKGMALHRLLGAERQFCQLAHDELLNNGYYKSICDGKASDAVVQQVAQELVATKQMQMSTALRRVSSWVSWYHDLSAGISGDTKALMKIRQRSRSEVENRDTEDAFSVVADLYKTRLTQVRTFQSKFRGGSLEIYGSRCVLTGITRPNILVASHIKPARDCEPHEAVDPLNSLLLEARSDKLFDQGDISFSSQGNILFSPFLTPEEIADFGLHKDMRIEGLHTKTHQYLAYHRKHVFLDGKPKKVSNPLAIVVVSDEQEVLNETELELA